MQRKWLNKDWRKIFKTISWFGSSRIIFELWSRNETYHFRLKPPIVSNTFISSILALSHFSVSISQSPLKGREGSGFGSTNFHLLASPSPIRDHFSLILPLSRPFLPFISLLLSGMKRPLIVREYWFVVFHTSSLWLDLHKWTLGSAVLSENKLTNLIDAFPPCCFPLGRSGSRRCRIEAAYSWNQVRAQSGTRLTPVPYI